MIYGWTAEQCLAMPARRFFAMRRAGLDLQLKKQSSLYTHLCDIAAIPMCNAKYYENTRSKFEAWGRDNVPVQGKRGMFFDTKDDAQRKQFNKILDATFAQKSKLDSGRRVGKRG